MGALNSKYEPKNVPKEKMEINKIPVEELKNDHELFEKIAHLSKELYSTYQMNFLNEDFCKKLSTVYKKKLFELDIDSLRNIHQQITNSNSNGKRLTALLSYTPSENEQFMVDEFKTQLREYLWNQDIRMNPKIFEKKGIVLDNIPMTIIDPQNKLRYIDIKHVNRILGSISNVNKNSKSEKVPSQNGGYRNKNGNGNGNENENENNNNNNSSSSSESNMGYSSLSNLANGNGNGNGNVFNRGNVNVNGNVNGKNKRNNNQFTLLKKKMEEANRNFGFMNQPQKVEKKPFAQNKGVENKNKNKNKNKNNNNQLQQFLNQIPLPPLSQKPIEHVEKNRQEMITNNEMNKNKNRTSKETPSTLQFAVRDYQKPTSFCSSSANKCALTKTELCKAITEHFIVRGNIIASILSTLPYKTENGFEGGYCYQRFLNLDKCQVCLPHNYQELMSMDVKTRIQTMMLFINYMTEKECTENRGLFRKLSLSEKRSLLQNARNGDEFNVLYTEYTQNVRQKYIEHLNILLDILNALGSMEGIKNEELNALAEKTRETIDAMVHLCQFYYLYAVIALLNANIKPIKNEEVEEKNQLKTSMKQFLVSL